MAKPLDSKQDPLPGHKLFRVRMKPNPATITDVCIYAETVGQAKKKIEDLFRFPVLSGKECEA